jgi:hypothetical protein
MYPKPFDQLAVPREVVRCGLPPDLADFYAHNEGVGLEAELTYPVRFCKLDEVARIGWRDLDIIGADEVPEGWEDFDGLRIGKGVFFEEIVYVLKAPSCQPGSILAIGGLAPGPGGKSAVALDSSLVLAENFPQWLAHLERWGWVEPSVIGINDLSRAEQEEICRYYLALNPSMNLGRSGSQET